MLSRHIRRSSSPLKPHRQRLLPPARHCPQRATGPPASSPAATEMAHGRLSVSAANVVVCGGPASSPQRAPCAKTGGRSERYSGQGGGCGGGASRRSQWSGGGIEPKLPSPSIQLQLVDVPNFRYVALKGTRHGLRRVVRRSRMIICRQIGPAIPAAVLPECLPRKKAELMELPLVTRLVLDLLTGAGSRVGVLVLYANGSVFRSWSVISW